jgi:hypothetical protein
MPRPNHIRKRLNCSLNNKSYQLCEQFCEYIYYLFGPVFRPVTFGGGDVALAIG